MKYIQKIQFLTFLLIVSSYIYCDATTTSDLQQREHAVKEFIQQETEKGTPPNKILLALHEKTNNSQERKAAIKASKILNNISDQAEQKDCFVDYTWTPFKKTPDCQLLEQDYKDAIKKRAKCWDSYINTPEYQARDTLLNYINLEQEQQELQDKKENLQELLKEKQKLAEKLGLSQ